MAGATPTCNSSYTPKSNSCAKTFVKFCKELISFIIQFIFLFLMQSAYIVTLLVSLDRAFVEGKEK